jgi:hypothetical protein
MYTRCGARRACSIDMYAINFSNEQSASPRPLPAARYWYNRPRIEDLVVELKPVNWHELGIQLQVPRDKRDIIDEDYRSSERKLSEVLQYWLESDLEPSWERICEVLQRIGGFGRLIRELRMKYCSLKTCREQYDTHGNRFALLRL